MSIKESETRSQNSGVRSQDPGEVQSLNLAGVSLVSEQLAVWAMTMA
jgi:hypothetical protein